MDDLELGPVALGVVVEHDRGSLPFALLHGEPLVSWAATAMEEAGVHLLDQTTRWEAVQESELSLVWHDALCPGTPPELIADCVRRAVERGVVVAAALTVTDTVKELAETPDGPVVGRTLDRDGLRHLASPLVLPPGVVASRSTWPPSDLISALTALRAEHAVELADAPVSAMRLHGPTDLARLGALTSR